MFVQSVFRSLCKRYQLLSVRSKFYHASALHSPISAVSCSPLTFLIHAHEQFLSKEVKADHYSRIPFTPMIMPSERSATLVDYTLPTGTPSKIIVEPSLTQFVITPPRENIVEKVDPTSHLVEKLAAHLIQIRKRKMKKHKLRKLRKRMKFAWAKLRLKREKLKEAAFKAELLSQIQEAQRFDAEKFVDSVLHRIRNKPRPSTPEERREQYLELLRKYRSNVMWIKPKFD